MAVSLFDKDELGDGITDHDTLLPLALLRPEGGTTHQYGPSVASFAMTKAGLIPELRFTLNDFRTNYITQESDQVQSLSMTLLFSYSIFSSLIASSLLL